MLFAVRMEVERPAGIGDDEWKATLAREKAYSQDLQRQGKWPHLWRCVGQYANLSVFDVDDNAELHELLWNLPLFPYMTIEVTPLAAHPSDIASDG
ncbi:MAG: muconolactone Delta-isomerase [Actinomycetota bacterium]|nr:muconolactone Delta-isomerase [Actinomycetota bacterium]